MLEGEKKIQRIAKAVLKLTDEDFKDIESIIEKQKNYIPLMNYQETT